MLRKVLTFGLPLALGMASHAAFNLIDLLVVGRLGENAVAAVHNGGAINFLPMVLGNGISIGAVAVLSQLMGEGDKHRARQVANFSLALMLFLGLLLGIAFYLAALPALRFLKASGESLRDGTGYLEVLSLGTFTMFLLMHVTGVLRSIGNARWPVTLLVGSNLLNLLLDIILIFGWEALGIPRMGVLGAAWATVLARGAGALVGLLVLARRENPIRIGLGLPRNKAAVAFRIGGLGTIQSTQMLVRAAIVITLTRIAGQIGGASAQAAIGVGTRLDTFVLFGAIGWASGATVMVGQSLGRREVLRCARVAWTSAGLASGFGLAAGILFALFSAPLLAFFVPDASPELLSHGGIYLGIMAATYPAASASLVLAGSLNGAGKSFLPMMLDLLVLGLLLQPALWVWQSLGARGELPVSWLQVLIAYWILLVAYFAWMRSSIWVPSHPASAKLSGEGEAV
ncbi:MAG: MATE family efflux transporter [Planctomycetota bacterium]